MSGGAPAAELPDQADQVVVGAGLTGACTAWAAARRGLSVVVLERSRPAHDGGSSHGSARIIRRAYPDPLYARLVGQAFERWRELEDDTATTLLRTTGGIDHGRARDVPALAATMRDLGVEHEVLDAPEAGRRWPGMVFDGPVLHHREAGTLDAAATVAAALARAEDLGAHVARGTALRSLRLERGGRSALALTDRGQVRAPRVVVAAGAWTAPLLAGCAPEITLPDLRVTQQQVFHLPRHPGVPEWPVAIDKGELSTYSLPGGRDGGPGGARKIAEHHLGAPPTSAQGRDGLVDPAARSRIVDHARRWLPGLVPEPFAETTCLYTSTANDDFVLDRVGAVVVCSPCSGHGAKFAPLIGERAVDLVEGGAGEPRFSLAAHAAAAAA